MYTGSKKSIIAMALTVSILTLLLRAAAKPKRTEPMNWSLTRTAHKRTVRYSDGKQTPLRQVFIILG